MKQNSLLILAIILLSSFSLFAQESVTLTNGDKIVGDLKKLEKSVLTVETDYSSDDFTIDWEEVQAFTSPDLYMINLNDGSKINGTVSIVDKQATITDQDNGQTLQVSHLDIVYLNSISTGFWDKMSISIDGGYTHSKANNNNQLTLRGNASYLSTKINPDVYFNFVSSALDANDSVRAKSIRNNYGGNFKMFFAKSWFGLIGADYLTSDELGLKLRSTYKAGLGYYPIRSHRMYLNVSTGAALNSEVLDADVTGEDLTSTEGFFSAEYNAFGIDDISIVTNLDYYPSFTESGRHRLNYSLNVKFDLPKDFYIGFGYTLNYDSQPTGEGVDDSDYVFQTTIGWSL